MKIALVTFRDAAVYNDSGLNSEDDLLLNFLRSKGLNLEKVIWNDTGVNWTEYDLAILKSPWDYFNLIEDFYVWLAHLESLGVRLLNSIETVKWNADKHYFIDIKNAGLNITPSIYISRNESLDLSSYFIQFDTTLLIVKPCVSGGSKNTFKVSKNNVSEIESHLKILLQEEDFMVQPFLEQIEKDGEWSFVFFGGKFSHALLKLPQAGEFRVQSMFGGTVHPKIPSRELLNEAQQYVDQFAKDSLYVRVDGIILNHKFTLMELELIEPFLFLETDPDSLERYYEALKSLL